MRFTRQVNTFSNGIYDIIALFTAKPGCSTKEDITNKVSILRNELVRESSDSVRVREILDENSDALNRPLPAESVLLELLNQLDSSPSFALQVFNWKRKSNDDCPMDVYEYSKGIKIAGKSKNIDLAVEIFKEAAKRGIKTTSTYNALMGAFMFNGLADRCQSLFCDIKRDPTCDPSIGTYNILISFFASWMWDDMEKVFQMLNSSPIMPNLKTYLLMLRGYALSANLLRMEQVYSLVRDYVNENEIPLIRSMICAYYKSSEADRVKKIGILMTYIPEEEYRPWLNVLLIKLYAQEDWLEEMENAINGAFEHGTPVITLGIMKCIIATYSRCNAVEKLENFVKRAELSGWKFCRTLYHCKLVMYGSQKHFNKMQDVLEEMESLNLGCTKRTFWIMYKAYWNCGQRFMVLKTLGQMFKHGHKIPLDAFPS